MCKFGGERRRTTRRSSSTRSGLVRVLIPIAAGATGLLLLLAPRPIVVTGTITDSASHTPVVGASVFTTDRGPSAVTDGKGRFSLRVQLADSQMIAFRVRAIGYNQVARMI